MTMRLATFLLLPVIFGVGMGRGLAAERATSADQFINTVGVNVHFHYTRSPYFLRFDEIQAQIESLGIRHLREGAIDTKLQPFYDHIIEMGKRGIKTTFIFNEKATPDFIRSYPSRVPGAFEAFEGPNEYNGSKDPDWATTLRTFQKLLYMTVKNDPSIAAFPVIGPSITSREADVTLGDLSQYMDFGNLHNYFGGRNPGTIGYGPMGYGSIAYNKRFGAYVAANKPLMSTETGFCDIPSGLCSPADVDAIYEPRMFLEQNLRGIVRTYQYELIDEGNPPSSISSHFGLLTSDLRPKASFTALKSMMDLLKDPGAVFTPTPLDISIESSATTLEHSLFEKRDGTYVLALWLETSAFRLPDRVPLSVTPAVVKLRIADGKRSGTALTYNSDGLLQATPVALGTTNTSLKIDDHVTFIKLPATNR